MKTDVVVVGAGPAGMMAAIKAAESGKRVVLFEKNQRAGKKLLLTGNGRCNVTNAVSSSELIKGFYKKGKFLYKALHQFNSEDLMEWLKQNGVPLIIEDNNRVFPRSEHSIDVLNAFVNRLSQLHVDIRYNTNVLSIGIVEGKAVGVKTTNGSFECNSIIIATGGLCWSNTGSDGSGYKFAMSVGHKIINTKPALTGLVLKNFNGNELKGLSFSQIVAKIYCDKKLIATDSGDMIFTHYGVSGPVVLDLSRFVDVENNKSWSIVLDLLPNLGHDETYHMLQSKLQQHSKKQLKNVLMTIFPERFVTYALKQCSINGEIQASHAKRKDLIKFATLAKQFRLPIQKCRPFSEAMITSGGVNLKEIDPATMESKLCKGLYIVGEALDIDGRTGGFNLQAAFATGYVAGINV